MRTYFGGSFIDKKTLKESEIEYPIKLDYYKEINENRTNTNQNTKYGIHIIQTDYLPNKPIIKSKTLTNITDDEKFEDEILKIFSENLVAIEHTEDVISDLMHEKLIKYEKVIFNV